jgi:hypothetical protein
MQWLIEWFDKEISFAELRQREIERKELERINTLLKFQEARNAELIDELNTLGITLRAESIKLQAATSNPYRIRQRTWIGELVRGVDTENFSRWELVRTHDKISELVLQTNTLDITLRAESTKLLATTSHLYRIQQLTWWRRVVMAIFQPESLWRVDDK